MPTPCASRPRTRTRPFRPYTDVRDLPGRIKNPPGPLRIKRSGWEITSQSETNNFRIIVEQRFIKVNTDRLTSIPYFPAMLNSGMIESRRHKIHIEGFTYKAVKAVKDYIYGKLIKIEFNDVLDVLALADFWLLDELKDRIEDYFIKSATIDNCVALYFIDDKCRMENVMRHCQDIVFNNLDQESVYSMIVQLQLWSLNILLSDDMVQSVSCEEILAICLRWVWYEEETRKDTFLELLANIGLTRCSREFMQMVTYVYEEKDWVDEKTIQYFQILMTIKFPVVKDESMIVLDDEGRSWNPILKFDSKNNTMEEVGFLPDWLLGAHPARCWTPYGMFACALVKDQQKWVLRSAILDIQSMAYVRLPHLSAPVHCDTAVHVKDKIYIIGGLWPHGSRVMYYLNLCCFEWTECLKSSFSPICLDMDRFGLGDFIMRAAFNDKKFGIVVADAVYRPIVACVDSMLYVLVSRKALSMRVYDTADDKWYIGGRYRLGMHLRVVGSVVTVGHHIYATVVLLEANIIEFVDYDTNENKWRTIRTSPPRNILDSQSAVHLPSSKEIVYCRGEDIIICHIPSKTWRTSSLKIPRAMANSFALCVPPSQGSWIWNNCVLL